MSAKTTDSIDDTPDAIDPYVPRVEFCGVSPAYGDRVVFDLLSLTILQTPSVF